MKKTEIEILPIFGPSERVLRVWIFEHPKKAQVQDLRKSAKIENSEIFWPVTSTNVSRYMQMGGQKCSHA